MRRTIFGVLFSFSSACALSQTVQDTAFLSVAKQNTFEVYQQALRAQARLYNGSRYVAPQHTLEEHPFFMSEDWITGSVFYDGEYFQEVPLMYDLSSSVLITEHYPSGHPIQLVGAKLDHFSVAGHHFEKIENESVANSLPQTGFYDVLYAGETKLVARRLKFMREQIVSTTVERSFEEKNRYFIFKNGVFFPVKSRASVLKVMGDKKPEMKRFLNQNRLLLSQDRELLMKRMAEYYDTL